MRLKSRSINSLLSTIKPTPRSLFPVSFSDRAFTTSLFEFTNTLQEFTNYLQKVSNSLLEFANALQEFTSSLQEFTKTELEDRLSDAVVTGKRDRVRVTQKHLSKSP
ncbi:hypothetical protein ACQ4M3_22715 [Leptolyngbya sp. AN03gr2]|uniref:hypothetical protein n=1 Tax=unclassified Leptolyngbya TaxID=2650499 RepID=UPI003D30EF3F